MSNPGSTADPNPRPFQAPPPISADVGVVAAMNIEVGFLTDRLKKVRKYSGPDHTIIEGEAEGKLIALIIGGMGRAAARRATHLLIDGHRPRVILSAGFAGALDPALRRFDVVLPQSVLDPEGQRFLLEPIPDHGSTESIAFLSTAILLTVDSIAVTVAEKAALRAEFAASLIDMETSAVAEVCQARAIKLISVRVISDEAEQELPPEVATLMTKSGSYRVGAALRAIWNRPANIKTFWTLHEHATEAADRLADATLAAITRLSS